MASRYSIEQDLIDLFFKIEEQDGEITEFQEEFLEIKQEELASKLLNYYKAIRSWEVDENACKEEIKRIKATADKYNNRIKRLKKTILDAVEMFGENGKTNKFIELPTIKFFTASSTSVEVDIIREELLIREIRDYAIELYKNDINEVDVHGVLDAINAKCKAEQGELFEPFTIGDVLAIKVSINITTPLVNILNNTGGLAQVMNDNPFNCEIKSITSKTDYKFAIDNKTPYGNGVTVASKLKSNNLRIK